MVKSIPQVFSIEDDESKKSQQFRIVDISQLQNGENPGLMVSTKIVNSLDKDTDVPLCFLLVDYKHNFCVTSIYHLNKGLANQIKSGSEILIKNPHLVLIQLNFKGYQYNYQCLKVTDVSTILVNGQNIFPSVASSEIVSNTFA